MGSINKSHNEADGGILLFSGELILLYCDSVSTEVGGKESVSVISFVNCSANINNEAANHKQQKETTVYSINLIMFLSFFSPARTLFHP